MILMNDATHLDPATILDSNARILAAEQRRQGANFLGPQMTPHRKPNAGGGPCDVCGCPGLRLGVRHYAVAAESTTKRLLPTAVWIKTRTDASQDTVETSLDWEGKPCR